MCSLLVGARVWMIPIDMKGYVSKDFSFTLTRYQHSLGELTFNSKPLIDDLTRTAGLCGPVGAQVVKLIHTRIMKVASPKSDDFHRRNFKDHVVSYLCSILMSCVS